MIGYSAKGMAIGFFVAFDAILTKGTPLFEEERHALIFALVEDIQHPILAHWPCLVAAFAADNHPVDAGQVEFAKVTQQRLTGQELAAIRFDGTQFLDTPLVVSQFHGSTDPSVVRHITPFTSEILVHPLRTFCKDLESMLAKVLDSGHDAIDERKRHILMEQVAHRADEEGRRVENPARFIQGFGVECHIEAVLVFLLTHAA